MSIFLNEDQELLRESVVRFVDEDVRPRSKEMEESDEFPMDLWEKAAELGLAGINAPVDFEGAGQDLVTAIMIMEEIGKASPTFALALDVNWFAIDQILGCATDDQIAKYVPELASGRKIGGVSMTQPEGAINFGEWPASAFKEGDNWRINCTKVFQTTSTYSGIVPLVVKTEDGDLIQLILEKDANTPGVEIGEREHKIGLHGSDTGTVYFNDVIIPDANRTPEIGSRLENNCLVYVAGISLGIMEEAFDRTLTYLSKRTQNGKPVCSINGVGQRLAELATQIEAAKAMTYVTARKFDEGEDIAMEAQMCKAFVTELAVKVVSRCIELNGGVGVAMDSEYPRMLGDAQVLTIAETAATMLYAGVQACLGIPDVD